MSVTNFYFLISDEIDSIMGGRSSDSETTDNNRNVTCELLNQLNEEGVFMIGATNTPWSIDNAFLRRFHEMFHIKLPNYQARLDILTHNIFNQSFYTNILKCDLEAVAEDTEGYSADDMSKIIANSQNKAIDRLHEARFFCQANNQKWFMCNPKLPGATRKSGKKLGSAVSQPILTLADLEHAVTDQKKTVNQVLLEKYKDFEEKH